MVTLSALLLLRLAAWALPGGFLWGIDFARFVAPAVAWPLVLVLVAGTGFALYGRWPGRAHLRGWDAAWPWALAALLLVSLALLPDRVRFVGDFEWRLGIVDAQWFRRLLPQTLPLDLLANHVLPERLAGAARTEPLLVMRGLGLVEGAILVGIAVRFASFMAERTAARVAIAAVLVFGGYATLLTGYSKPTPQLALCTLAAGTLGIELVRSGRAAFPFAAAITLAIALHRGALPLMLAWAVAAVLAWRRSGAAPGGRGARVGLWPLLVPVLVLAWEAPFLLRVIRMFDAGVNFAPAEVREQGGALAAAFAPLRLLDAVNAVLLHAPFAPLAGLACVRARRSPEALFLATLVLAFVPVLLFVYLPLGPFRDYDALAPAGAAFAVASAWALAAWLERAPRARALGAGVTLAVVVPFLLVLASLTDLARGYARAEVLLAGPPARHPTSRASVLDWMGLRALSEERYDLARDAYRRLCAETPLPRAFKLWGASALIAGSPGESVQAFERLLERSPQDPVGWYGLWVGAAVAGDSARARRASERVLAWGSGSREMRDVVEFFEHYPRLYDVLGEVAGARDSLPR